MTQLGLPLDCVVNPYMMGGFGAYNNQGRYRDDGCDALEAALHVKDSISSNTHRSDTNSGFHRVTDGQQQIVNSIFTAENDIRTDLDSVKNLQNQNSLHNLNATRESKDHVTAAVNAGTIANLEATRNVGEDLSDEICDVAKDSLKIIARKPERVNLYLINSRKRNLKPVKIRLNCNVKQTRILLNYRRKLPNVAVKTNCLHSNNHLKQGNCS